MSNKKKSFNFYPYLTSKNFNKEIYRKKEFYINKTKKTTNEKTLEQLMDDKCTGFKLSENQKFLKTFMSNNTPYNGILLFHGTGVGKTCSSISIAEQYVDVLEKYNKKVIILLNPSIEDNFRKNIFNPSTLKTKKVTQQCLGDKYLKKIKTYRNHDFERDTLSDIEIEKVTRKVDNRIKAHYRFQGYQEFSNKLIRLKDRLKTRPGAYEKKVKQFFSNSVLIVDEAHNIKDTNKDKQIPKILEEVLDNADELKLILLTATPMFNEPNEIVFLLNLLLRNNKQALIDSKEVFNVDGSLTDNGGKILQEKSRGIVSYLRGENPLAFPLRLDPHSKNVKTLTTTQVPLNNFRGERLKENEELQHLKIIPCVMKQETPQRAVYDIIAEIGFGPFENIGVSVSNIVFPGKDEEDYQKKISNDGFFNNFKKSVVGGKVKITPKSKEAEEMLKISEIGRYSTKMREILKQVSESETDGIVFIYSRYVWSGVVMLGLLLEMEGFHNINGNLLGKNIGQKKKADSNYMIISGDQELSRNNYINYIKKEPRNKDGKKVKIILGSESASEGLDFKYIREVHILDPWHHLNKLEQVIGRGIRYCSHIELKFKERNVTVFKYAAVTNENPSLENETADLKVYRDAENKDKNMADVAYVLKKSAVDCNLNLYSNKFVDTIFEKPHKIKDSKGNERTVNYKDTDNSRLCNYKECNFVCEPNLEPEKELPPNKIDEDTFDPSVVVENINQVINIIKTLFTDESILTLGDISKEPDLIKMNIDSNFIQICIDTMVKNELLVRDKFNNVGKLISRGKYYIFTPSYIQTDKITFREITRPLGKFTSKIELTKDLLDVKVIKDNLLKSLSDKTSLSEIKEMIIDLEIENKMYYMPNNIKELILKQIVRSDLDKKHELYKFMELDNFNLLENILTRNNTVDFIKQNKKDSTFGFYLVTEKGIKIYEYSKDSDSFNEPNSDDQKAVMNYLRRKAKGLKYKKAIMFAYLEIKKEKPIFKVLDMLGDTNKSKKKQSSGIILRSQGMARSSLDQYIKNLINAQEFHKNPTIPPEENFKVLLEKNKKVKQLYKDIEGKRKDKNNLYDLVEEMFIDTDKNNIMKRKWFFTVEEFHLDQLRN